MVRIAQCLQVFMLSLITLSVSQGQDSPSVPPSDAAKVDSNVSDPVVPSEKIREALDMIRRVEKFEKLAEELEELRSEFEKLRAENARLRSELERETMSLPVITVKSKAISSTAAMAMLQIGERSLRVRDRGTVMISLGSEATTLRVAAITRDHVKLEFVELKRTIVIND